MVPSSLFLHMVGGRETSASTAFTELLGAPEQVKVAAGSAEVGSGGFIVCVVSGVCCWGRGFSMGGRAPIANTKQDKPLLIRLAAETDGPRGARIPGGLESDCAL